MEIGTLLGLGVGFTAAAAASPLLFRKGIDAPEVSQFNIDADGDSKVVRNQPSKEPVPARMRQYLPYAPNWTVWPDFQRVLWLNHTLKMFWPYYNMAVGQMILENVKPMLDDTVEKVPFLQAIDFEAIDLGTKPLQIGGIKTYNTSEDEVIFESPGTWGSNVRIRMGIRLKLGPLVFYLPIEVTDLQMKANVRVLLRPLVETMPCIGAVTITLLELPYVDASLHIGNRLDIMQLPGIKQAVNFAISKVMGDMLLYPNSMSFDIMENGGVQPPPQGILHVTIVRIPKLSGGGDLLSKVDPYVKANIREARASRTKTLHNTNKPVWNETFSLIVDEPQVQSITFNVMDDDLGAFDDEIGTAEIPLLDADFITNPRTEVTKKLLLLKPEAAGQLVKYAKAGLDGGERAGKAGITALRRDKQKEEEEAAGQEDKPSEAGVKHAGTLDTQEAAESQPKGTVGELEVRLKYLPFRATGAAPGAGGNEGGQEGASVQRPKPGQPSSEQSGSPSDSEKGILTVTLVRAFNLEAHGTVDAFVEFILLDPTKDDEKQISSVIPNEPDPRWGQKFDFVMADANSNLLITVFDKKGGMESLVSLKTLAGKREKEEMIGNLRLKVADVVRNQRLRDTWALGEVQRGDIDLILDWTPVVLDA